MKKISEIYSNCWKIQESARAWFLKEEANTRNFKEMPLHRMATHKPQCMAECPYTKACMRLWETPQTLALPPIPLSPYPIV